MTGFYCSNNDEDLKSECVIGMSVVLSPRYNFQNKNLNVL